MARRRHAHTALLLLAMPALAALAALASPAPSRDRRDIAFYDSQYSSESPFDPFDELDYDSSEEPVLRPKPKTPRPDHEDYESKTKVPPKPKSTPRPTPKATPRPGAKVTVSAKVPKVTVKNKQKGGNGNKATTVNIESFTRFVVTQATRAPGGGQRKPQQRRPAAAPGKPPRSPATKRPKEAPGRSEEPDKEVERVTKTPKKGSSTQRPRPQQSAQRRPSSKKPQKKTTTTERSPARRPSSKKPPTKRPPPPPSPPPRRTRTPPSTAPPPPPRTTRAPNRWPQKKIDHCPPKETGWLSSFFEAHNKITAIQQSARPGILNKVYDWLGWSDSGSEEDESFTWLPSWKTTSTTTTTTTTTPAPPPTTTEGNWFYSLLNSEEDDGAYALPNNTNKTPRRSIRKSYNGYQLLRAYPEATWKVHELLDLQEETQGSGVMWWTAPSANSSTDVLVPPDLLADMKDQLNALGLDHDVVIWDLNKAIMYENPKLSKKQRLELEQLRGHPLTWRRYHRYADVLRYLEYLQHSRPDLVDLVPLGRSSEGLPLVAVKISLPSNDSESWAHHRAPPKPGKPGGGNKRWKLKSKMKPAVWLEAGAHAREWIAPAVATWILHTLVEGEKGLGADYEMLKAADWYIAPLLNPDGYEHTHTHDRLWSKTRSKHTREDNYYNSWFPWNWGNTDCVGVDSERNYDYHWGEKGASKDPCSDHYAGPHPFSEPETRAVSQFLMEHKERIKVYVSLHAYSQMWLVPSTHARVPYSDDGELLEMGRLATAALADMYGTKYQVGTMADLAQPSTGTAFEWAKARAGVKYTYSVKLRDLHGPYGFLLPGSQIVPTAKETWVAIKTIVDNL